MADDHGFFGRRRANRIIPFEPRGYGVAGRILGALLLVVILIAVFWPNAGRGDDYVTSDAGDAVQSDGEIRAVAMDGPVRDYLGFVDSVQAPDVPGLKHEYTAEGIRRLAAAIFAVAVRDSVAVAALEPRIRALRAGADALERAPSARTHARRAREAFLVGGSVLQSLQDRRYEHLERESTAVLKAAEEVRLRKPLVEQAEAIQRFFDRSAELLRAMRRADG